MITFRCSIIVHDIDGTIGVCLQAGLVEHSWEDEAIFIHLQVDRGLLCLEQRRCFSEMHRHVSLNMVER